MNFKDLERLQRRIEKLQLQKKPPKLKCLVVNESEEIPTESANDPYTLIIGIENKRDYFSTNQKNLQP